MICIIRLSKLHIVLHGSLFSASCLGLPQFYTSLTAALTYGNTNENVLLFYSVNIVEGNSTKTTLLYFYIPYS